MVVSTNTCNINKTKGTLAHQCEQKQIFSNNLSISFYGAVKPDFCKAEVPELAQSTRNIATGSACVM